MESPAIPQEAPIGTFQVEDLTIKSALQTIFAACSTRMQLAMGATEVTKALYRVSPDDVTRRLKLVVLAADLHDSYRAIILERCQALGVPVINMESRAELAEIAPVKRIKRVGAIGVRMFAGNSREEAFIAAAYQQ